MTSQKRYLGKTCKEWSESLQDADPLLRRLSAYALGELGADARDEAPRLHAALQDPVEYVRVWAAAALARVEPNNSDAVKTLTEATESDTYFVRSLAVWHLGRLGREHAGTNAALCAIKSRLDDEDISVRTEASIALDRLSGKSHRTWSPVC